MADTVPCSLEEIKPGNIFAMPCIELSDVSESIMALHHRSDILLEKANEFYRNTRPAYRALLRTACSEVEVPEDDLDFLLAMAPNMTALVNLASFEVGQTMLRNLLGQPVSQGLFALLRRLN